jgi:diphthamide synthase (EF-2-diphthine--ammonia ligase)
MAKTDDSKDGGERIRSPFTSREREFLRSLAGIAKDQKLLSGYERKLLFEGGEYHQIVEDRPRHMGVQCESKRRCFE